jgi:hypothetical protein
MNDDTPDVANRLRNPKVIVHVELQFAGLKRCRIVDGINRSAGRPAL